MLDEPLDEGKRWVRHDVGHWFSLIKEIHHVAEPTVDDVATRRRYAAPSTNERYRPAAAGGVLNRTLEPFDIEQRLDCPGRLEIEIKQLAQVTRSTGVAFFYC